MPSTKEIETLSFIDYLDDIDANLIVLLEEMNIPVSFYLFFLKSKNIYLDFFFKKNNFFKFKMNISSKRNFNIIHSV